jgi:hypothetical protein
MEKAVSEDLVCPPSFHFAPLAVFFWDDLEIFFCNLDEFFTHCCNRSAVCSSIMMQSGPPARLRRADK